MEYPNNLKWRKAKKRVEALKGFYQHLAVYIVVNIFLFIIKGNVLEFFQNKATDENFLEWVDWNIFIVPLFWGIGLLFHAAKTFQYKIPIIKNWEERTLKKYMDED